MQVVALETGYGGKDKLQIRNEGDKFEVPDGKYDRWYDPVDPKHKKASDELFGKKDAQTNAEMTARLAGENKSKPEEKSNNKQDKKAAAVKEDDGEALA